VGDTCTLHPEPFQRPVARGDGPHKTGGDMITLELHSVPGIKFVGPRGLLENFIDRRLEVGVKGLEEVFKQ